MLYKLTFPLYRLLKKVPGLLPISLLVLVLLAVGPLIYAKIYQHWDRDPDRGAIPISNGHFGESYSKPKYLDQGWTANDSLWFYNTSQGSGLVPYDMFLVLKQAGSNELFRSKENLDKFRYLPQKETFFNPDALPVGFTKMTYRGKDYVGYTCAACHTGQINHKGKALRIDGGPAMADMVGFLTALEKALEAAQKGDAQKAFVADVLKLKSNYSTEQEVLEDLEKWKNSVQRYNIVNHSNVKYGHARLDAFGRIYNRVAQYSISKDQLKKLLELTVVFEGQNKVPLLTKAEVDKVMEGIGDKIVLSDEEFSKVVNRLLSNEPGYPGIGLKNFLYVRNQIFNKPDAPVSYPFLWDISHSDYLQWNGIAANAGPGPLGRNTGEVIGVFGILDWGEIKESWLHPSTKLAKLSPSAWLSGQRNKQSVIGFNSSINLFNLQRLESRLRALKSPEWPFCRNAQNEYYIPETTKDHLSPSDPGYCQGSDTRFNEEMRRKGELVYIDRCRSCHTVVDRSAWDRIVISHMSDVKRIGTDPAMAENSVNRTGKSGNFTDTYQATDAGTVIVKEDAPVVQILTAATKGVIATPDADKWWPQRMVEWVYAIVMSFADNTIKASIKSGDYKPDTTAEPYASLGAYKGRSLNGIWATAPYLHNGSVPTLWDLLGPPEARPKSFKVGAREFDPVNVGFKNEGENFNTIQRGNLNTGHDYFCVEKPRAAAVDLDDAPADAAAKVAPPKDCMSLDDVWNLIEYLKSL